MTHIDSLSVNQINLLVAKLEGVEVEIYTAKDGAEYVTERLPFSPEGPANYYPPNCSYMLRFYQPATDWELAGPIIERERIFISYSDKWSGDAPYAWSFYSNEEVDDRDDVLHEATGVTGSESAMRSFVAKHFGSTIDLQNLPKIERTAIVSVNAWKKNPLEVLYDFEDSLFREDALEVVAETQAEAVRKANEMFPHLFDVDAYFQRWK